jgi:hypothetical protein
MKKVRCRLRVQEPFTAEPAESAEHFNGSAGPAVSAVKGSRRPRAVVYAFSEQISKLTTLAKSFFEESSSWSS